jgi:hypothetical protein
MGFGLAINKIISTLILDHLNPARIIIFFITHCAIRIQDPSLKFWTEIKEFAANAPL